MSKRPKRVQNKPIGSIVRTATLLRPTLTRTGQEQEQGRREREAQILERMRPELVPGERVYFSSTMHGSVVGPFKQIDRGGRIVVTDSKTGLPLSCDPSEVHRVGKYTG